MKRDAQTVFFSLPALPVSSSKDPSVPWFLTDPADSVRQEHVLQSFSWMLFISLIQESLSSLSRDFLAEK